MHAKVWRNVIMYIPLHEANVTGNNDSASAVFSSPFGLRQQEDYTQDL